ncbi:MAG TPA: site-2 protease family protein [Pirellulales bacterium]|nr:site-2 protease family protein [Pirellulales bacterium]
MFLIEPPRTQYDINFRVAGVPVRVHPLFWLVTAILGASRDTRPVDVFIWVAAVFISILVHELGHAVMIHYFGWQPRVVLYSFGGLAAYEPTWHRTWPQVIISFAGPAAGFILAALVVLSIYASGHSVRVDLTDPFPMPVRFELFRSMNLNLFVYDMLFVNIYWGFINLLPIFPLDGGRIAQEVLVRFNPANGMKQSFMISIFAAAGLAIVLGLRLNDLFTALFFGYFAIINYQLLQQYDSGYGGRGW